MANDVSDRFTVTKCDEYLPNGVNERRLSNMNTIDIKDVIPKESKIARRTKSVAFETGRQRWKNLYHNDDNSGHTGPEEQAYDNPAFSIDSDSEDEEENIATQCSSVNKTSLESNPQRSASIKLLSP